MRRPSRRLGCTIALAVRLVAGRNARAQPVVTLEDASARAIATHEQIRAADADRDRAAVAPWRAVSVMGPTIREVGSYTRRKNEIAFNLGGVSLPGFNPVVLAEDVLRSALEVSQPIYTHQVWGLRDIGKAEVQRSDDAYRAAREDVLLAVAAAYYDALRAQTLIATAEETRRLAGVEIDHAEARVRAGAAVRTDVLRAESLQAHEDQQVAEATGQAETARDLVRRLAALDGEFTLAEPAARQVDLASVEPFIATALTRNPDLAERQAALAAARGEERRRVGALLPNLGVQLEYQNLDHESFADRNDFWTLMLRAEIPLVEGGGARWLDVHEQRAVVERTEAQVAGFRRDLEVNVRRTWVTARTLEAQRKAAEREVAFAAETYRTLSDQYAAGVATNLDVQTALTTLDSAQAGLTTIRYAHAVALVQLDRVTGALGEPAEAGR